MWEWRRGRWFWERGEQRKQRAGGLGNACRSPPAFELHICIPNTDFQIKDHIKEINIGVVVPAQPCPSHRGKPGGNEYPEAHSTFPSSLMQGPSHSKMEFRGWAQSFSAAVPWIVSSKFSILAPSGHFESKCYFPSQVSSIGSFTETHSKQKAKVVYNSSWNSSARPSVLPTISNSVLPHRNSAVTALPLDSDEESMHSDRTGI